VFAASAAQHKNLHEISKMISPTAKGMSSL